MLDVAVQEIESAGLVALNREAIAGEIELSPPCEVVLVLCLLGPILKVSIVDRFRMADVVDSNDEWMNFCERLLALEYKLWSLCCSLFAP